MTPNITDKEDLCESEYKTNNGLKDEAESRPNIIQGYTSSKLSTEDRFTDEDSIKDRKRFMNFKTDVKWLNVVYYTTLHVYTVYCILTFNYLQDWRTTAWLLVMRSVSGFGLAGGTHRYWTHRTYKATRPFQVFLVICYETAGQNRIFDWVRDHRVHHKYSDTDADPHNINRGFFFAHIGWLMMKKHPEVIRKGRQMDMSDITNDPLLVYADRYRVILQFLFAFLLPTLVPVYFWNETWGRAFVSQCIIRYVIVLNTIWSINSFAHTFGTKPYDKTIKPTENMFVEYITAGEGFHNYHHAFPMDYRTSELGTSLGSHTTYLLNGFSKLGWVYDMKKPSQNHVESVVKRNGDGTRTM